MAQWSQDRRYRLFRTIAIAVVVLLVLILWRGCSTQPRTQTDKNESKAAANANTTTSAAPVTAAPGVPVVGALKVGAAKPLFAATYKGPAAAAGDSIVMMGGVDAKQQSTVKIWQYTPASGATANVAVLGTANNGGASVAFGSTVVLLGGGSKNAVTDAVDSVKLGRNAQQTLGKLPAPRTGAVAVMDPGSKTAYLVGGTDGKTASPEVLASTDGVTWKPVATLAEPVSDPAVTIGGGAIWVFGGMVGTEPSATIQRIDLATRAVSSPGKLPAAMSAAMAFTLNDNVFVAGGRTAAGRNDSVLRFDPVTATTAEAAKLPNPLSDAGVAVVGSTAYLLGGMNPAPTANVITLTAG